jgi:hypothetical protein
MIRLKSGRLLLVCDRADRTWHARIILGPKPEQQLDIDTGTIQLHEAMLRAQNLFQAAVGSIRPREASVMCWDCLQWDMASQRCELSIPESKRSGGRYAVKCEMFDRALPAAD